MSNYSITNVYRTALAACLALLVAGSVFVRSAAADGLDDVKQRGTLIWGGDESGGAPYVFPDPKDNTKFIGFEVELADELAKELGVKAQFKQGQWDTVPALLDRGTIDIALNGYELSVWQKSYLCTRPYYMFGFQFLVRRDSPLKDISGLQQSAGGRKLKIGALSSTAAEKYLQHLLDPKTAPTEPNNALAPIANFEEIPYDGTIECLTQTVNGVIDGTLQDDCAAIYYANDFPQIRRAGRVFGQGYYVALTSPKQPRLAKALDDALGRVIADGRLKTIYDRWDMSGKQQMLALDDYQNVPPATAAQSSFLKLLRDNIGLLLQSAGMTVFLSVTAMPLAILIGILVAVGRLYGPWPVAKPLGLYVEILRGTPLMLQLYAIFFLLPKVGIALPALAAAIAGLAINYSAYESEIYRAGLQAVPRGQLEAALSLGMSRSLAIRRILLPQAFRIVIPPVTNDFIALFKDTSVCSVITVIELTKQYSILALSTQRIVELAAITAVLYMLMSYPLSVVARWSEKRLAEGRREE